MTNVCSSRTSSSLCIVALSFASSGKQVRCSLVLAVSLAGWRSRLEGASDATVEEQLRPSVWEQRQASAQHWQEEAAIAATTMVRFRAAKAAALRRG
ncbi:hypothetical protein NL676_003648 [Syzygium grande]|nr:hypothetical protein NL676_003648 [Syzygium grande]